MQEHPLFPALDADDEQIEVEQIHVTRFGGEGQKWCAYLFGAEELTELQQIAELFGGGNYELIARAGGRITGKRKYPIDGRQRPLIYGSAVGAGTVEPEPVPVQRQAATVSGGQDVSLIGLMLQSQSQQNQMMMQMMQSTTATITAMATSMVSRDSESSKTTLQAMTKLQESAMSNQAQFFQAMLQSRGGGGSDVVKSFREGLELGKELQEPTETDEGSTIGDVMQGIATFSRLTGDMTGGGSGADDAPEVVT